MVLALSNERQEEKEESSSPLSSGCCCPAVELPVGLSDKSGLCVEGEMGWSNNLAVPRL